MMLAAMTRIWISSDETPLWVKLVFGLPTVLAVIALVVVLLRERRKRSRL
jgi:hypothetical protein